jgi:hypothetical protein
VACEGEGMAGRTDEGRGEFRWRRWLVIGLLVVAPLWPGRTAFAASLADRVFEATLSNGLKVLLVEEPKAPS